MRVRIEIEYAGKTFDHSAEADTVHSGSGENSHVVSAIDLLDRAYLALRNALKVQLPENYRSDVARVEYYEVEK